MVIKYDKAKKIVFVSAPFAKKAMCCALCDIIYISDFKSNVCRALRQTINYVWPNCDLIVIIQKTLPLSLAGTMTL